MMNTFDDRILKFIKKHHILNLSVCKNDESYCCTCFYAFDNNNLSFIFTSENNTRHHREMISNNRVSGTIALETKIIGKIQGVQFTGVASLPVGEKLSEIRKLYLKKFPYSLPFLSSAFFWMVEIDFIKMTDNNLGFGKKLLWYRHSKMPDTIS